MYSWLKNYAQEKLYYAITLNSCCSAIIRRVVAATSVHTPWALGRTDIWEEYPECARVCPVSDTNSAGSHQGWHSTLKPTNHPPIDRFAAHYAGRALLGAPAASVGIGYGDLLLLGLALNVNPMSSNHFVELGTYKGTTSLYLGMAARMRLGKHGKGHGRLDTFDIADLRSESVRHAWLPEMFLHVIDIEGELLHANGFHPHPLVVDKVQQASLFFIDAGLKRIEAFLYAHCAPVGLVLVIHDVVADHEQDRTMPHGFEFLTLFGFAPIFVKAAEESGAWARVWIRKSWTFPDVGTEWRWQEEVHSGRSRCGGCDLIFTWRGERFGGVSGSSVLEVGPNKV